MYVCYLGIKATELLLAWNPVCLGLVEGIIGKIQLHADLPLGLILIRQKALVGQLPGDHKVYKITKIVVIPLSEDEPQDLELEVTNADCLVQNVLHAGSD
ncbi:hypothetical protein cypCar_00040333 [Cyprinus carpio]|nr:hypothetical protein cypCar_00040333 [Cyprinus carpio]